MVAFPERYHFTRHAEAQERFMSTCGVGEFIGIDVYTGKADHPIALKACLLICPFPPDCRRMEHDERVFSRIVATGATINAFAELDGKYVAFGSCRRTLLDPRVWSLGREVGNSVRRDKPA